MTPARPAGSGSYRVASSEQIAKGRVIAVRRDHLVMPDGSSTDREIVEHPGAVGVVAIDDDERVVIVNQYRHPVECRLDELPAGLLDVAGEPAVETAKRELFEEAGLQADEWHVLIDLHTSPGMTDEAIRIFLARGLADADGEFEREHEEVELTSRRVPLGDLVARALSGDLTNAAAVAGVMAAAVARADGWTRLRPADAEWPARPGR